MLEQTLTKAANARISLLSFLIALAIPLFVQLARADEMANAMAALKSGDRDPMVRVLLPLAKAGNVAAQGQLGHLLYQGSTLQAPDYGAALPWLRSAATHGDADAQGVLGSMFAYGLGVTLDYPKAIAWFEKAAAGGNAHAQAALGAAYILGQGAQQSCSEGLKWLHKAVNGEDADGEYLLGLAFGKGQCVGVNLKESTRLFQLAADHGETKSRSMVGYAYLVGRGVEMDAVQALKWFILASAPKSQYHESPDAAAIRDASAKNRDLLIGRMSPQQVAEAREQAARWRPAESGKTSFLN